jgi:deazaflavin-dependent oxidoreductase (nitroreductase family)
MLQNRRKSFQLPRQIGIMNKYVTNRLLHVFVHLSLGPFALLRHIGRRSGKPYETVIWVWLLGEGFVIALTYGEAVDWYHNLLAARGGEVLWHKRVYGVGKPEPMDLETALPAFPAFLRPLFRRVGMRFVWMQFLENPPSVPRS